MPAPRAAAPPRPPASGRHHRGAAAPAAPRISCPGFSLLRLKKTKKFKKNSACERNVHVPGNEPRKNPAASPCSCQVIIGNTGRRRDVPGQAECGPALPRRQGGAGTPPGPGPRGRGPPPAARRRCPPAGPRPPPPLPPASPAPPPRRRSASRPPLAPPSPAEVAGAQLKEACVKILQCPCMVL